MRVIALLCTLAVVSGFAPASRGPVVSQLNMADEIQTGTVKWFDKWKGFGFIVPDDGTDDVFVHQTVIKREGQRSLMDGEKVEFKVGQNSKDSKGRKIASDVTGPDGAECKGAADW
eukprot:CAMPEP_0194145440 /NCGR_PEP_ID=MMETSP0152-20130528/17430_1 /TAXON_ID=1049557 /ORGANISM="Thalassiothrix antarctica, Strain L6-D1" /LENGTH=115 /DNA_ID=CAMNT_0038845681 /DNA_START=120 /DNA_END=464 /DNA_ORIENTATION=-